MKSTNESAELANTGIGKWFEYPVTCVFAVYPEAMTTKQKDDFHFGLALIGIYSVKHLQDIEDHINELSMEDKKRLMRIAATFGRNDVIDYVTYFNPRIDTTEALIQAAAAGRVESVNALWPKQGNTLKAQKAIRMAVINKKEEVVKRLSRKVNCRTLEEEMTSKGDLDGLKLLYSAIGDLDGAMKIEAIQTKDVLSAAVNAELNTGAKQRRM
ncbi:hypothetical protein [Pseudoxanthomonas winnipegensis]|uniref:hypothetical protein n=1 Tax=Pseudoxanthomonas winnipegensis TaxID=2480810 RepID=UPI00103EA879|nr:hypothetical protein [Pseudoxanthomonas winnipegensis]TBV69736.1 hypothetical protein EYC45_18990 [Pseudoxanthomonas winnipegensis]